MLYYECGDEKDFAKDVMVSGRKMKDAVMTMVAKEGFIKVAEK